MTQAEVKTALTEARRKYNAYVAACDTAEAYRHQLGSGCSGDTGTHTESKEPDAAFVRLCTYYQAADTARYEWMRARDRVWEMCIKVEAAQREVLIYRYLNNFTFEDIAERLGYSIDHVFTLHRLALKSLCKILET